MTTQKTRVILDTNLLISQIIRPRSVPRAAFEKAIKECVVLISTETIKELHDTLLRPDFDIYISKSKRRSFIRRFAKINKPTKITETISDCRDSKDNKFLELAVSGCANFIVTGDQDLLVLDPFRDILIITPAVFLEVT